MTYWLAVLAKIVIAKERSDCGNLMAVSSAYCIDMLLRLLRRIFSNPPRNDKQFRTSAVIAAADRCHRCGDPPPLQALPINFNLHASFFFLRPEQF